MEVLSRAPGALSRIGLAAQPELAQLVKVREYLGDQLIMFGFSGPGKLNSDGERLEDIIDSLSTVIDDQDEQV